MLSNFAVTAILSSSIIILPMSTLASCPPENYPVRNPSKCWTCDKNPDGGFGYPSLLNEADSWTNFYCKYSKPDFYSDGKRANDIVVVCYYNDEGKLIDKLPTGESCPSAAIKTANCDPVTKPAPYSGPYEKCCPGGCKLTTDNCLYCPKKDGVAFVDVDITKDVLTCTYNPQPELSNQGVYTCTFNTADGKLIDSITGICGPEEIAPQRDTCLKSNPSAKLPPPGSAPQCPAGPRKDECEQSKYVRCRATCPNGKDHCKNTCASDECLTCPSDSGADYVEMYVNGPEYFACKYYKNNNVSKVCDYSTYQGTLKIGSPTCAGSGGQHLECARLRKGGS